MKTTKPKLIIVEGCQGSGKSSVTNYLRENMLNTNLIRLSGLKDKSEKASLVSYLYHSSVLTMISDTHNAKMNWVLDRSYISDYVYANLGFKEYDFKLEFKSLSVMLGVLSKKYDVHVFLLTASEEVFKERLNRDKAEYEKFSVESSLTQQESYLKSLKEIELVCNCHTIDTSSKTPSQIGEMIISITI